MAVLAMWATVSGCRICYPRGRRTRFLRDSGAAGALHPLVPMAAPRTVWRIRLPDGSVVHCVLWERKPETAVVWYRDDEVRGVEEFLDPAEAEGWAATLRDEVAVHC